MSASFRRREDARDALVAMNAADHGHGHHRVIVKVRGLKLPYRIDEVWKPRAA